VVSESLSQFPSLIVFDTETSGLDPQKHQIIELSAILLQQENQSDVGGNGHFIETDHMDEYVRLPKGTTLDPVISRITGITEEMLSEHGHTAEAVADMFVNMMNKGTGPVLLVAHNAQFDGGFLRYMLKGKHIPEIRWLDSLTVYKDRAAYPHKLCDAIQHYGLEGKVQNSHRAIDDTIALLEVLNAISAERDDLAEYINFFGYNPKYGMPQNPIRGVKYSEQPYYHGLRNPTEILPRLMPF
jgi:DNA polymerase III epsilon subunit-like protein